MKCALSKQQVVERERRERGGGRNGGAKALTSSSRVSDDDHDRQRSMDVTNGPRRMDEKPRSLGFEREMDGPGLLHNGVDSALLSPVVTSPLG